MHVTCDPTDKILASNHTKLPWLSLLSGPRLPTTILYIRILSFPVGEWVQEDFLEVVAIGKGAAQVQMANAETVLMVVRVIQNPLNFHVTVEINLTPRNVPSSLYLGQKSNCLPPHLSAVAFTPIGTIYLHLVSTPTEPPRK